LLGFDGFYGPDGQLSLKKIGEAFKLFGEQCVETIHEMFQNGRQLVYTEEELVFNFLVDETQIIYR